MGRVHGPEGGVWRLHRGRRVGTAVDVSAGVLDQDRGRDRGVLHLARPLRDIRPSWKVLLPSLGVGLIIIGSWLLIDQVVPYPHIGARMGFDPGTIESDAGRIAFLLVRFSGLVIVVPVMEELFWRSFLLRYLTGSNPQALPIGTFSLSALAIMVVVSATAHTEWLVAAIASVIFAYWLRRTKSLFAAIVSHAAANGALGLYILQTHDWKYW